MYLTKWGYFYSTVTMGTVYLVCFTTCQKRMIFIHCWSQCNPPELTACNKAVRTFSPQALVTSSKRRTWFSRPRPWSCDSADSSILDCRYLTVTSSSPVSWNLPCVPVCPSPGSTVSGREKVCTLGSLCFCIVTIAHSLARGKLA